MANVGLVPLDQLNSQSVQFVKVIAGVSDFPRFVTQPSNHLQDTLEIHGLLLLGVGVVVPQVTLSVMVGSIAEVDEDGFGMTDMKEAIRLRRETGPNLASRSSEMLFSEAGMDLRVLSRLVERAKEPFFEYGLASTGGLCSLFLRRCCLFLGLLEDSQSCQLWASTGWIKQN